MERGNCEKSNGACIWSRTFLLCINVIINFSCGKCENCSPGYSGDFCEVDDTACLGRNGLVCSEHGKCRQGKCDCDQQWIGSDCSLYCTDDKQKCMVPYFNEVSNKIIQEKCNNK